MKCEKCGKELESLEVDMFDRDGSDDWYDVEINEDHGVVTANVTPEWTGDGLSEEEYHETIRCPHCRQFPFIDKFVDAATFISLVMYPRRKDEAEGETMKTYKDWICRYYSEHEDGEPDGEIIQELIRCKDCTHNVANRETDPNDITDYSGTDIVCDYFMTDGLDPDDYCSKAERKEE